MCDSQSKVLSLLQPPVEQLPLLPQPLGAPSVPLEQLEHPICIYSLTRSSLVGLIIMDLLFILWLLIITTTKRQATITAQKGCWLITTPTVLWTALQQTLC